MSSARHRWAVEVTRAKWRVLDRCAKCGVRRWLIEYRNRSGQRRSAYLFSTNYDPWQRYMPDCDAPVQGQAKGESDGSERP